MFNKMNENVYIIMEKDQFDGLKDFIQIYQYLENQLQIYHIIIHISMGVLSQRHFQKGNFPSDNFQSGNFPNVQFPKRQLPNGQVRPSEAPQAAMGTKRCDQEGLGWPSDAAGESQSGRALRLEQAGEVASCDIALLRSCYLGNTLGKLPLGILHFWKVATWEIPLGSCRLGKCLCESI